MGLFSRLALRGLQSYIGGPARSWVFVGAFQLLLRYVSNQSGKREVIDLSGSAPGDKIVIEHLDITHGEQIKQIKKQKKADKRQAKIDGKAAQIAAAEAATAAALAKRAAKAEARAAKAEAKVAKAARAADRKASRSAAKAAKRSSAQAGPSRAERRAAKRAADQVNDVARTTRDRSITNFGSRRRSADD